MARELGLFGLTIPEQYGGIGLDLAGKCAIEEEMGRTNYGFATVIGNHTGISTTGIVALGSEAQKRKYLPRMASGEWVGCFSLTEPQAGSNPADIRTSAVKKGDRYVLNGEKIYTTNGGIAQVFTVMAVTDKAKGIKGISAFIIERGFKGFSHRQERAEDGHARLQHRAARVHRLRGAGGEPARPRGHGLRAGAEDADHGARDGRGALLRHDGQADRALRGLHEDARAGRQEDRRAPGPAMDARRHGRGARRLAAAHRSARSR